jgi:two-component system, NarL family, invasion response regulator UvrY
MIKIVLADDHALVRMGFKMLLENEADIEVIAEVDSGEGACELILNKKLEFDVLVIDLTMGGISGIEATRRIISHKPDTKILGLSAHEDPSYIRHMMHAGASAYLSKRSAPDSLITAIRAINAGQLFIDPHLKDLIAERQQNPDPNPIDVLSEKEFEVFIHLAKGASANDVAEILNVSPRTTGTHLYNIKQKLNASTQSDLTLIALRHDLIKP